MRMLGQVEVKKQEIQRALICFGKGRERLLNKRITDFERVCGVGGREIEPKSQKNL